MEKASKWIQNLLLGKRDQEKKEKKRSVSSSSSSLLFGAAAAAADQTPKSILPSKEKRRWSFKKSSAATDKVIRHKTNRSFDEIYTAQLVKQALQVQDIEQIRIKALLLEPSNNNSNEAIRRRADLMPRKYAAAVKIQSVFRSYLARRALRALRALVKLQALVRGHLVRKQTNAVLRCMHSLMTIQVRARFKRVQMADPDDEADHPNNYIIKTTTLLLQADQVQPLSINDKINESTMQQQSRKSTSKTQSGPLEHHHHRPQLLGSSVVAPTYMSDTESSKAKNRSQSEPKQRPKGWSTREKSSSRRSTSTTEEHVPSRQRRDDQQQNLQYPWLFKLYRSAKPAKESDIDSASVTTYNSNYYATPFEQPPVNLY